jgi:hypothetical protein
LLASRASDGRWQALDRDATKFAVDGAGTIYSLGTDGWTNINGQRVWENTRDFCLSDNGSIHWQSTNGSLYRRQPGGSWKLLDRNVTRFAVGDDGRAFCLRGDHWVSVDGTSVWENTHDFVLSSNQTLFWHSTNGALYRRPSGGTWQLVGRDVKQFAVCQDGSSYTLNYNGKVTANGTTSWSGIVGLQSDRWGRLILEHANGATTCVAGQFSVGTDRVTTSAVPATKNASSSTTKSSLAVPLVTRAALATSRVAFAEIATASDSRLEPNASRGLADLQAVNVAAKTDSTRGLHVDLLFSRVPDAFQFDTIAATSTDRFDIESIVEDVHALGAIGMPDHSTINGQLKTLDDAFAQSGSDIWKTVSVSAGLPR